MPNLLLLDGCTFFLSQENGDVESLRVRGEAMPFKDDSPG